MTEEFFYDEYTSPEGMLMLTELAETRDRICDFGPLITAPDSSQPGLYHSFANPTFESEKRPIITFSNYLYWNESEEYTELLNSRYCQRRLKIGKRPYTIHYVERYIFINTIVKKNLFYKVDNECFINDVIVTAEIAAIGEGHQERLSQWYRIRIKRSIAGDLTPDSIDISIYDKEDDLSYPVMTDYLVPNFRTKVHKEQEVYDMLSKYYEKAVKSPCPVIGHELADNMGYDVAEAVLSPNRKFKGRILDSSGEIMVYNPDKDRMEIREFKKPTILIDHHANQGRYYDSTNSTIIHECIHGYTHPFFMKLQHIYWEELSTVGIEPDLETLLTENADCEEIRKMEKQAKSMTAMAQMPVTSFETVYKQILEQNTMKYFNADRAIQETITDVSKFYIAPKASVKIRMSECGIKDGEGINVRCNGGYIPRHSWSRKIAWNQSYTIERSALDVLVNSNARLKKLLHNKLAVYVEGHICLNHEKYVTARVCGGYMMTSEGRKDLSKCCLLFSKEWKYGDIEYTAASLNNIDKRGLEEVDVTDEELDIFLNEVNMADELPDHRRDDFYIMLKKHKDRLSMTEGELATVSTIEPSRLHNIMINNVKKISVREVVAIALGLGMQPEEIFEFVKKSSAKFEDNYDDFLLQMLIKRKYMWSVPTFNAALVKMNQPPLVEDWRTAESRRKKKSTVTT